jgi:hypothetical protein
MATLAETGERIGIPTDLLEDLIELPVVAEALHSAAANPEWAPRSIWKGVGRPTIYLGEKLKIEQLQMELVKRRELATRTSDGRIVPERLGSPLATGRMQKAETVAKRRREVIEHVHGLLMNHAHEPRKMDEAKTWLETEIAKSTGGDL